MADRELTRLCGQWNNKIPKKYKPSLINDVHNVVINATENRAIAANIQLLIHTNYFNHVLWEYFDPDVIINHIELIAILFLYDLKWGNSSIVNEITADSNKNKLDKFLIRVLSVTFDIRENSNFRLHRIMLMVLKELCGMKNDQLILLFKVLSDSRIYEDVIKEMGPEYLLSHWLEHLVVTNIRYSYVLSNDVEYIEYLKAVVLFCNVLKDQHPSCLNNYSLSGFNMNMGYGFQEFLKILVPKTSVDFFELFKNHYYGKKSKWNSIISVPTVYDLEKSEWFQFMSSLDIEELRDINKNLGLPVTENEEAMKNSILNHVLNWKLHTAKELSEWTEEELFDRFEGKLTFPLFLPTEKLDDYDFSYDLRKEIYDHLVSVLGRLKISLSKSNKLSINGKSKYFYSIDSITKGAGFSTIEVTGNPEEFENSVILLLKITNPNKYSSYQRVKKYGLEKVVAREVLDVKGNKKTQVVVQDVEHEFSHIIKIFPKTFWSFKNQGKSLAPSLVNVKYENPVFLAGGVSSEYLYSEFDIQDNKRRKFIQDGNNVESVKIHPKTRICQVVDPTTSRNSLSPAETKAISECLINKITKINIVPNGNSKMLNNIINNLRLNFKDQSVLIVTPHDNWTRTINLPTELSSKTGRLVHGLNDMKDPLEMIDSILERTRKLIAKVGLNENYSGTVESAISFHQMQVPKIWNQYLQEINKDVSNIKGYPFEDMGDHVNIQDIVDSYFQIVDMGRDLISLSPILKFPDNETRIKQYMLLNYHKYVIISQDQIFNNEVPGIASKYFDSVIFIDSSNIHKASAKHLMANPYKRIILMGDTHQMNKSSIYYDLLEAEDIPEISIDKCYTTGEIQKLYENNYKMLTAIDEEAKCDFKHSVQIIPLKNPSSTQVNVPEAEYCVGVYKYLTSRSLDARIISSSLYQQALFKEMGIETEHINEIASHDYLIVSCFGYEGIKDLMNAVKRSTQGIYFVGDISEPINIHRGVLEVKRNQKYIKIHEINELK